MIRGVRMPEEALGSPNQISDDCDFVVVGAGSAGCAIAARLSESGQYKVILLEAGGEDKGFWLRVPLGYGRLYNNLRYNWMHESEPEPELENVRLFQPRGKVLGGSSSINGMIYIRGQREDFDHWRQLGNVGWSYDDVLPFYRKAEDNERGASEYHAVGGPLGVSNTYRHELADAFIAAAEQAGYPRNPDFNGARQEGFGYNQLTTRGGRRCSTAVAYIKPARHRENLKVIVNAIATRVLFDGREATGVEYEVEGRKHVVRARREVIVSSGATNSPQLLQLSGVGPADLLRKLDIPVVAEIKEVGEDLQDHFGAAISYRCNRPISLNNVINDPIRRTLMGLNYILFRKGPMAGNAGLCSGFVRTDPALSVPDIDILMWIWSIAKSARRAKERVSLDPFPGFTAMACLTHPESRGSVRAKSRDPNVSPEIRFNHLTAERDRRSLVGGLRAIRRVMSMPSISSYIAEEVDPGPGCVTDDDLLRHLRTRGRSTFHSTSTCRMGVDSRAVVDPRLRVRGFGRLRVADASIMPRVISGNTNAATIMIGEKAASMILEDAK